MDELTVVLLFTSLAAACFIVFSTISGLSHEMRRAGLVTAHKHK